MINVELLVSTMNREKENLYVLAKEMNIKGNATIVNQIPKKNIELTNEVNENINFISVNEKGLSRSRNLALNNSKGDICVIADDDLIYVDEYCDIIRQGYEKYHDADIIAFVVEHVIPSKRKKILKEGKVGFLKSMKIQSVQVTFRRNSIMDKNIKFDDDFGSGSKYSWGEENIFLFDCMRKKLKMYYVPIKIADLKDGVSMWNKDNTPEHYMMQGAIYYRMSKLLYWIFMLQFVIRKRKIYAQDMTSLEVLKSMIKGMKEYKDERKNVK